MTEVVDMASFKSRVKGLDNFLFPFLNKIGAIASGFAGANEYQDTKSFFVSSSYDFGSPGYASFFTVVHALSGAKASIDASRSTGVTIHNLPLLMEYLGECINQEIAVGITEDTKSRNLEYYKIVFGEYQTFIAGLGSVCREMYRADLLGNVISKPMILSRKFFAFERANPSTVIRTDELFGKAKVRRGVIIQREGSTKRDERVMIAFVSEEHVVFLSIVDVLVYLKAVVFTPEELGNMLRDMRLSRYQSNIVRRVTILP